MLRFVQVRDPEYAKISYSIPRDCICPGQAALSNQKESSKVAPKHPKLSAACAAISPGLFSGSSKNPSANGRTDTPAGWLAPARLAPSTQHRSAAGMSHERAGSLFCVAGRYRKTSSHRRPDQYIPPPPPALSTTPPGPSDASASRIRLPLIWCGTALAALLKAPVE